MGNQVSLKLQRDEDGLPTLDELGGERHGCMLARGSSMAAWVEHSTNSCQRMALCHWHKCMA